MLSDGLFCFCFCFCCCCRNGRAFVRLPCRHDTEGYAMVRSRSHARLMRCKGISSSRHPSSVRTTDSQADASCSALAMDDDDGPAHGTGQWPVFALAPLLALDEKSNEPRDNNTWGWVRLVPARMSRARCGCAGIWSPSGVLRQLVCGRRFVVAGPRRHHGQTLSVAGGFPDLE